MHFFNLEEIMKRVFKKDNRGRSGAVMALILGVAMLSSGCSVVGLGVGAAIDDARSKEEFSNSELSKVKAGSNAIVILNDGTMVAGKFGGVEDKPEEEYLGEYDKFREENGPQVYLPGIGDTLRIISVDGYQGPHRFEGFDYARKNILAEELGSLEKREYPLRYLSEINNRYGESATGEELRFLLSHAEFPLKNRIRILGDAETRYIDAGDINSIEQHMSGKRHAKWIGLGIGLAIDITAIIVALTWDLDLDPRPAFGEAFSEWEP
jgi:hypothetical protein